MKICLKTCWLPTLLITLIMALIFSLWAGSLSLTATDLFAALLGQPVEPIHSTILFKIRLPRALLAALVGAALGSAGGVFQAVLRNPLADPYILGVSGGAALGAVFVLTCGYSSPILLPIAAFFGACAALFLVYWVAQAHKSSPHTLILSGVMVGSFASALLLFLLWRAPSDPVKTAVFWLAGNLDLVDPAWLPWLTIWVGVAFISLWIQSRSLDLFTQGEEVAADLGLDIGRSRFLLFIAAGALTAGAVAMAGLVGFVGLTVPHVVRLFLGNSHRHLLPASALLGAAFLVSADALSRILLAPAEIPVGVVTAMIGAPFFLYLLRKQGGRS
jgi:iron complex transport system permease protein